ncbi:MAG: hypothetical protein QME14_09155 [Methanobacteriaceae archaeon]|nr:hypothetical protein [Methanobacteriaceae archaeon]
MAGHKQVEIEIDEDFTILVDEGLEDIIKNFFHWEIDTCNSCIDYKGSVWIEFCDFNDWKQFLQLALRNNIAVKGSDSERETLWDFLQEKAHAKLVYDEELMEDPNNEDEVIGTGVLVICVGLMFPKESLDEFKELFFEVLEPE